MLGQARTNTQIKGGGGVWAMRVHANTPPPAYRGVWAMGERLRRIHLPHPHVPHPQARVGSSRSDRFAEKVAAAFGSMGMFYALVCWQLGWMGAAVLGVPLLKSDPYPFVFCLFLSNLIQLWALPVLGVATNRAEVKQTAKTDADHEALTHIATQVDAILVAVSQGGEHPVQPEGL